MKHQYPKEFIRAIPKSDLHVHLDGSLRLKSLIELSREQKRELPSFTEAGLKEKVFKEHYSDLSEYLHGFKYTCAVLRTPEALERVAYEHNCQGPCFSLEGIEMGIDDLEEGVLLKAAGCVKCGIYCFIQTGGCRYNECLQRPVPTPQ